MRVRLFASLRELAGASEIEAEAPHVGALLDDLERRFGPAFARIMRIGTVVVDGRTVGREHPLAPADEVALLPPVSGGSGRCRAAAGPPPARQAAEEGPARR